MSISLYLTVHRERERMSSGACAWCDRMDSEKVYQCSRCDGKTGYCSRECQVNDWRDGGHQVLCDALMMESLFNVPSSLPIEGFVAMSKDNPTEKEKEIQRDGVRTKDGKLHKGNPRPVTADKVRTEDSLMLLVAMFDQIKDSEDAWWNVATEYFRGVGARLRKIHAKAFTIAKTTTQNLESSLRQWAIINKKTNLKRIEDIEKAWQQETAGTAGGRTPADQGIQFLKEKRVALIKLITACNVLLGPPKSMQDAFILPLTPQGREHYRDMFDDETTIESMRYVGLKDWRGEGIYLNYDWDDAKQEHVMHYATVPILGDGPSTRKTGTARKAKSKEVLEPIIAPYSRVLRSERGEKIAFYEDRLVPSIAEARYQWLMGFQTVLQRFRDNVIGMYKVKQDVASFVRKLMLFKETAGMLNFGLFGNPGTGKSFLASKLSDILYYLGFAPVRFSPMEPGQEGLNYVRMTKPDFIAPYEGQSSHLTRMTILKGLGTFMGIDEAYELVTGPQDSFGREALTQLVNDIDEYQGLISIGLLGYEDKIRQNLYGTNPGLARRISDVWVLPVYSPAELFQGLVFYFKQNGFVFPVPQESVIRPPSPMTPEETTDGTGESVVYTSSEQQIVDILTALHEAGVFKNINMGFASPVIEKYRGVYSDMIFSMPMTAERAERQRNLFVIDYKLLEQALADYANDTWGLVLQYYPDVEQKDIATDQYETSHGEMPRQDGDGGRFKTPVAPRKRN